jgi:hypothetical protein
MLHSERDLMKTYRLLADAVEERIVYNKNEDATDALCAGRRRFCRGIAPTCGRLVGRTAVSECRLRLLLLLLLLCRAGRGPSRIWSHDPNPVGTTDRLF